MASAILTVFWPEDLIDRYATLPANHTIIVDTCIVMKNVTFSAEEHLIDQARRVARARRTTLNAAFRRWLVQFTAQAGNGAEVAALMNRLRHVRAGRRFSRDQMNEQ